MNAVKYMQRIAKAALAYGLFLVSLPSHAQITAFNQLGFLPSASKIIVVPNVEAGAFYLVEQSNNHEMLRGPLTQPQACGWVSGPRSISWLLLCSTK